MRREVTLLLAIAIGLVVGLWNYAPALELRDSFAPERTKLESQLIGMPKAIGKATWYDASLNGAWFTQKPRPGAAKRNQEGGPFAFYAAAGPELRKLCGAKCDFRWGKKPYRVIVTNMVNGRSIIAWVVDWCQCRAGKNEKLIDLAPAAWTAIAGPNKPLSHGVLKVKVEVIP
jgi:hypothetical protein